MSKRSPERTKVISRVIEVSSRSDEVLVYVLSDMHIGNAACKEKELERVICEIRDSGAYWICLGDTVESIGPRDVRMKLGLMAKWLANESAVFRAQRDYAARLLRPIGERCLMYLKGNHEETVESQGIDMYYSLAEDAGIPPDALVGMSGFLQLTIRRQTPGQRSTCGRLYTIYAHHGWGGGMQRGSKVAKLIYMMGTDEADIYLMGHHHVLEFAAARRRTCTKTGRLVYRKRFGIICGTFQEELVQEDTSYAERHGAAPADIGYVRIHFRGNMEDPRPELIPL